MRIETLKYYIQSSNLNFLYGSGLSRPYLATLGNIEKRLTELGEKRFSEGEKDEYTIVEASVLKQYFETVILPNVNPKGLEYEETQSQYRRFLSSWNDIINNRSGRLVGKCVNLFTTNVDLMMERSALGYGVELNDGFQGSIEQVFDASNFQKTISKTSLHFHNVSDIPIFNLIKIHGSINWMNEADLIKNDIGLSTVSGVKDALEGIDKDSFVDILKSDGTEKTLDEMIDEAGDLILVGPEDYDQFLEQYRKIVMINPTKRKFRDSVIDDHFYELMRQYSNNLEKENTLLIVSGFSFADEHIADITRRASNTNPTLHIVIFAFNDREGETIKSNLKIEDVTLNNNIEILTPSLFKEQNAHSLDERFAKFALNVVQFDFTTINSLYELIAKGVNNHDK